MSDVAGSVPLTVPGDVVTTMTDGSILVHGLVVGWTTPEAALMIAADPMIQREIAADFSGLCRSFPKIFTRKRPSAPGSFGPPNY